MHWKNVVTLQFQSTIMENLWDCKLLQQFPKFGYMSPGLKLNIIYVLTISLAIRPTRFKACVRGN